MIRVLAEPNDLGHEHPRCRDDEAAVVPSNHLEME
jgi:hypothetical protein